MSEIQVESFADSGYSVEDWAPVLKPFDEHEEIEARWFSDSEDIDWSYQEFLKGDTSQIPEEALEQTDDEVVQELLKPESRNGMNTGYDAGSQGVISQRFSPYLRDKGVMLEGHIEFDSNLAGSTIAEVQTQIVEQHATPYIQANENLENEGDNTPALAFLEVPENYDPETLADTVQSIVDIYQEASRFEEKIENTVENYEIG